MIRVPRFNPWQGLGIFLFTIVSSLTLGPTHPPIQWVMGAPSLEIKRTGREADHSLPSSAEFKNMWSYTSTPQYVFIVWCLVKHSENFTLTPLCKGSHSQLGCVCACVCVYNPNFTEIIYCHWTPSEIILSFFLYIAFLKCILLVTFK
jgi:hypothetical protein